MQTIQLNVENLRKSRKVKLKTDPSKLSLIIYIPVNYLILLNQMSDFFRTLIVCFLIVVWFIWNKVHCSSDLPSLQSQYCRIPLPLIIILCEKLRTVSPDSVLNVAVSHEISHKIQGSGSFWAQSRVCTDFLASHFSLSFAYSYNCVSWLHLKNSRNIGFDSLLNKAHQMVINPF